MITVIKESKFKHEDGRYIHLKLYKENSTTYHLMSEQLYINKQGNVVKRVNNTFAGSFKENADKKYNDTINRYLKLEYRTEK